MAYISANDGTRSRPWMVQRLAFETMLEAAAGASTDGTLTAGPAMPGTSGIRFCQGLRMPSNKVLLVPEDYGFLGLYDGTAKTYADGPAHGEGSANAYSAAVWLPNGTALLIAYQAARFAIYDPATNTLRKTAAHGYTTTNSVGAFWGGVLAQDDLVYCSPGYGNQMGVYDWKTDTLSLGPTLGMTAPQTGQLVASTLLLPDGDLMVLAASTGGVSYRVKPSTGAVTAISSGNVPATTGTVTTDGSRIILATSSTALLRQIDLGSNTVSTVVSDGAAGTPFHTCACLLPDGRIAMGPGGGRVVQIYNPFNNTVAAGPDVSAYVAASGQATSAMVPLSNGEVLIVPTFNGNFIHWKPLSGGAVVPEQVRLGRYYNRR